MEVAFRYAGRSGLRVERVGAHLGLATSERRTFVDGSVQRADVVAAALLLVARVAASRYDEPVSPSGPHDGSGTGSRTGSRTGARTDRDAHDDLADLVEHADPFLTTGDGLVRFESMSACGGVAARLDLLPDGLDVTPRAPGTTTVDLGPRVRELLAGVLPRDPLHLSASAAGLDERAFVGRVQERRLDLTARWLRSLAALPVLASDMRPRARLTARHARTFVRGLPAGSSDAGGSRSHDRGVFRPHHQHQPRPGREESSACDTTWLVPVRDSLRTLPGPAADALRLDGAWRLRVLEPLVRHATGLRVHEHEATGTTWWELELPFARLGVALSAHPGRAFADEALGAPHAVGDERAAALAGLLAYDLAETRWFDRVVPVARDLLTPDEPTADGPTADEPTRRAARTDEPPADAAIAPDARLVR